MIVRDATAADAVAACEVMRASIVELCGLDHYNDPEILKRWLANKTPENVAAWVASSAQVQIAHRRPVTEGSNPLSPAGSLRGEPRGCL